MTAVQGFAELISLPRTFEIDLLFDVNVHSSVAQLQILVPRTIADVRKFAFLILASERVWYNDLALNPLGCFSGTTQRMTLDDKSI
jgi:hypothetical protein